MKSVEKIADFKNAALKIKEEIKMARGRKILTDCTDEDSLRIQFCQNMTQSQYIPYSMASKAMNVLYALTVGLLSSVATYDGLPEEEFRSYAEIFQTHAFQKLYARLNTTLDQILTQEFRTLGEIVGSVPKQEKL